MVLPLNSLLRPKSVAVIGASNDASKFGGKVALNVHRSKIPVRHYVNASGGEVLGEKSYQSLADLPSVPETIVLAVPADAALSELRRAGEMGVRAGVVFAAGFREAGCEARERELADIATRHHMAVLGPNCIGLANFADGAILSSADGLEDCEPGGTALIAQSGSLGIAVSSRHRGRFRHLISTGNETVVNASEILSHLLESDPGIRTFALLLEAIHDREELARAADLAAAADKRVVLLKLAGTAASGRIAALHTGAVSGRIAPLETFCRDHHILLARTLREFNAILTLLSMTTYSGGRQLGIFTTSGGTAVLSAGFAEERGLSLPQPPAATCAKVAEILGMQSDRVTNPLDTTGIYAFDAQRFGRALSAFAASGAYDLVLVPLGGAGGSNAASRVEIVAEVARTAQVPIIPVWQQQRLLEEDAFHQLYRSGLPMYTDFESPIEAMAAVAGAEELQISGTVAQADSTAALPLDEGLARLHARGVPVPPWTVLGPGTDPADVFGQIGTPVALKVSHPHLLHKSDASLVVFPVNTAEQFKADTEVLWSRIGALGLSGAKVIAQAGVPGGIELLCGLNTDVEMGPYAVLAAGGIYTEILNDSTVVLLEPEAGRAERIESGLRRLKVWPILAGARGKMGYDIPAAIAAVEKICRFFATDTEVMAMEVNPLIVLPAGHGAAVVDVRLLTASGPLPGSDSEGGSYVADTA